MKVLVTGAEGMVGSAVAEICSGSGDRVTAAGRRTLDITDREAVRMTIGEGQFDAVINCAAYTDVDGAESDPEAAAAVNAFGVEKLAEACAEGDCRFVTISTDYVFDGRKGAAYDESDPTSPESVYAATKVKGESLARAAGPASVVVRTGWIFGPGGTNFLSAMPRLLRDGKSIKAISDSFGTPTYAFDLAVWLRELAGGTFQGVIHIVNSGQGTSYLGFAEEVCRAGGFDSELVIPVRSIDLKRPAPRPADSRLTSLRLKEASIDPLPHWRDAIRRFVSLIKA